VGKIGARVVIGIPTLSTARRSVRWIDAMASIQMPLGSSMGRVWVEDQTIAQARNALVEEALRCNADYLFMLGDDVLVPDNVILSMLDKIGREFSDQDGQLVHADMITGIYWTKTYPTEPYIWRDLLRGSYRDWKAGEFFTVDMAGCDCLMIDMKAIKEVPSPWFSTDWSWEDGQVSSPIATEDFYFYLKMRQHGKRLFADTAIQCLHEDRTAGVLFGLQDDMPQAGGVPEHGDDELLIADLGSGTDSPFLGERARVVRFDLREEVKPDVRCDLYNIPEEQFGQYDEVRARHVLEHFPKKDAPALLAHWAKLLKPYGTMVIEVPNVGWAFEQIQQGTEYMKYAWDQLYGGQNYGLDFHKNGFTERKLAGLMSVVPVFGNTVVELRDNDQNLRATSQLIGKEVVETIGPGWRDILNDYTETLGQEGSEEE
jgi:hypothetical protein